MKGLYLLEHSILVFDNVFELFFADLGTFCAIHCLCITIAVSAVQEQGKMKANVLKWKYDS